MMRLVERAVLRASLPVSFSQGFNPHPVVSLSCPRPVGVASECDLLVAKFDSSDGSGEFAARLDEKLPQGVCCTGAFALEQGVSPRPVRMEFVMELDDDQIAPVRARLDELSGMEAWEVQRIVSVKRGRREKTVRTLDIAPLVDSLHVRDRSLDMVLTPSGDLWARPGEVLKLLDMDERTSMARLVRTNIDYGLPSRQDDVCRGGIQNKIETEKSDD